MLELDTIYNMDCMEGMKDIPDDSVDMVLCDMPYGTTEFHWDVPLDIPSIWREYERIVKPSGAIVLFGQEPFSSTLRLSNKMYKYDWIWLKSRCGNVLNCKNAPLKAYECISVFSRGTAAAGAKNNMTYNPIGLMEINKTIQNRDKSIEHFGRKKRGHRKRGTYTQKYTGYPKNILEFPTTNKSLHPTQKPVALCEYLIRTYTNDGETVLDNCMGSGTTAVAAINTGRHFIGFEKEKEYFDIAMKRIEDARMQTRLAL